MAPRKVTRDTQGVSRIRNPDGSTSPIGDPTWEGTQMHAWWRQPEADVHKATYAHAQRLMHLNASQRLNTFAWRHFYNDMMSNVWSNVQSTLVPVAAANGGISHNVICSAVDSVASQVFKDPPRVRVVSEMG